MNTFSKEHRLLDKAAFNAVFSNAKKLHCSPFVVLCRASSQDLARLGLVIGKKKVSKAVERNRLKRVIRESFRKQKMSSLDVVVIAKHHANHYDNASLFKSLDKIWSQLNRS